jgi:hypothetical protein
MSDLLPELNELAKLGIVSALLSDEECKKRLAELVKATMDLEKAQQEFQKSHFESATMLADARAAVKDETVALDNRKKELDERERVMTEVSESLNVEKTKWEAMRAQVNEEMGARDVALSMLRDHLEAKESEVKAREAVVAESEAEADGLLSSYLAKHKRLKDALEANEE